MLDRKSSFTPGDRTAVAHAPTPGKQTLTQGLSGKPKGPSAPTAKPSKKKPKPGKSRAYQMWVHEWVQTVTRAQILDLDPDGTTAGADDWVSEGQRGKVVAEIVDGPIQVELTKEDPETGQLRRVWIQREDAALVLAEDSDQMSHDPERSAAAAQAGSEKTGTTSTALCELGQVSSLGEGFCAKAGRLIEALVPDLGDSSKLVLRGNVPVAGGLFYFSFSGSVERDNMIDDDQYKARLEFAVGYEASVETWLIDAFAQAGVFGFLESSGDTGKETLELLMYAIWRAVSAVSTKAAKNVMGGRAADVEQTMDREDYAQIGAGVRASAGIQGGDQKLGASVEGSVAARYTGTGAKGKETGKVDAATVAMAQLGLGYVTEGVQFAGGAAVTGDLTSMDLLAVNASATGTKTMDLAEVKDLVGFEKGASVIAAYGLDALTAIGPVVAVALEKLGMKASQKSIDDHLLRTAADISGARVLAAFGGTTGAQWLAKRMGADLELAVPMSYEVAIEFEWKPGIGASFSIQLKRISAIELGEESRAGAYAKIENATRIFKIQLNNQGFKAE